MITELHTERLLLRKMKVADSSSLFGIWSDPEVTRYMNVSSFTDEQQAKDMIQLLDDLSEDDKAIRYSVILTESSEIIGSCGYNSLDFENAKAEIGYDIAASFWGRGYASEAVRALLDHAFSSLELNRVEAKVDPANMNSIKLLHKLDFTFEGTLRQSERVAGRFNDLRIYSKLKSD
ncbi:GNAT family N-acetyltransferase [Paenibacillus tritici]|uniref:GNAT family N-acetyltransferase n=1 Tax=Paenibacillus tritici TaxID=1873425 RepID=UPI001BAB68B8|nr:GNAT family protein [Paenibacillus tritici]QUL54883.1 GNAT family N-acetyltransferase [Paenibacillus tritici]